MSRRDEDHEGGSGAQSAPEPRRVDRRAFTREFPSGDPTATEVAQNLMWASQLFLDADARTLRRHGLSPAARILLATVEGAGRPLSSSEIADRLFVTGASVTSLVDTLEKRGLVRRVRDSADRRVVLVELTDRAQPVIDAFLADITALHAAEFAVLDPDERETLVLLLAKVATKIEALDVERATAGVKRRRRPRR